MGRAPCCDKANVKRGPWSPEEDAKLKSYIEEHGTHGNWIALPQKMGLRRCGKSCRLRWLNYLRPNIRHGGFSEEEDRLICSLYVSIGSRWSIIAAQLPGRTDNDIKNYWNTKLKKKLLGKQRKDLEHQYSSMGRKLKRLGLEGNISHHGLPNSGFNSIPINNQGTWPLNADLANVDDHSSMRSLLMKLGGTPINGYDQAMYNLQTSFPSTADIPQISNQMMNIDGYNVSQAMDNNSITTFPAGVEELLSSINPASSHGLDLVDWERMMMINGNGNGNGNASGGSEVTSCGESQAGSWGDMSSFVSLPMAAGVSGVDHAAFDELRYN